MKEIKQIFIKVFGLVVISLIFLTDQALAQRQIEVSGNVFDSETNKPLEGVTIRSGLTSTISGEGGAYTLQVGDNDTLMVSSVGYASLIVKVNGRSHIDISLTSNTSKLDELVVVGYGKQERGSLTSSISTLTGASISKAPVANINNALGGTVPGVVFKQRTGEPGRDQASIFIRGISSLGSNNPLIIVDGIVRDFSDLDPNTIESFSILKDAASIAPYGVAGANGVILVTTKRGSEGKPTLSYNGYVGFQNPTVLPHYTNGYEYALLRNAAAENDNLPIPFNNYALRKFQDGSYPDVFPTADDVYDKVIKKNSPMTSHNIQYSGGTDRVDYFLGLGYLFQGGIWDAANYRKFNLTANMDYKITKTTKVSLGLNAVKERTLSPSTASTRLFELLGWAHNPDFGPLVFSDGVSGPSILWAELHDDGYNKVDKSKLYMDLSFNQKIPFVQGLELNGRFAYDPTLNRSKLWHLPTIIGAIDTVPNPDVITTAPFGEPKPFLNQSYNQTSQTTYQVGFNYNNSFGRHNVGLMALFESKMNNSNTITGSRMNFDFDIDELNMGSANKADETLGGTSARGRQIGIVYRVNYNFNNKYYFEASGREDGNYYFAPGKRFGFFPAFSAAWRISNENFFNDFVQWIDNLKLRGSYGHTGALAGGPFQYLTTFGIRSPGYAFNGSSTQTIFETKEPNPDITWERAKMANVGIDISAFDNLLSLTVDYFHEKRSNMLIEPDVIVPLEYGVALSQVNAGVMSNQGFEFSLGLTKVLSSDLTVALSSNFTYAKNRVEQIFETDATFNNPNRRRTGRVLNTQFGYKAIGFFQENDFSEGSLKSGIATQPWGAVHPGDIRYADLSGDGKIDEDDIIAIGDPVASPRIVYSFTPVATFKGFSVSGMFQGAAKTNFYINNGGAWPFWNGMASFKKNLDYWRPDNINARNPRITTAPTLNNTQTSSFWMKDGSYLRLKRLIVAYVFPTKTIQFIQNLKLYISGENLMTWDKLEDYDPEITPIPGGWSPDAGWVYPQQKVFAFGLDITF